jgi:hypothetical protein
MKRFSLKHHLLEPTEIKWLQQLAGKDSGANSAGSKSAAAAAAGE